MKLLLRLCLAWAFAAHVSAQDSPSLNPHLEPFRPWLGRNWRAESKDSKTGKVTVDVTSWERALNGNAIRIVHSINDGAYGGEAIVQWDEKTQSITYHYFTTDTFSTAGTMTFQDAKILAHDVVSGEAGKITETRTQMEMRADGTYEKKGELLRNGVWEAAASFSYRPDSSARVVFK